MGKDNEGLEVELGITLRKITQQLAKAESRMVKTTNKWERDFKKANAGAARSFNKIDRAVAHTSNNLSGLRKVLIGALSTREITRYADAWTVAGNKIAASGVLAGRSGRSLSGINDIADETRSGLTETADLYAKLLRATKDVAKSELEVATATTLVNKAFKAGGAAASEQAAGILQLAQGLSSGMLQGDELRSIRENAPVIAQAIADEFGVTIGKLKELGSQGELTSARVFQAILKAQPRIEAAFSKTNATIGEGFTRLRNALTEYVGFADDSIGATEKIGNALVALSQNIELVIAAGGILAGVTFGPALMRALIRANALLLDATAGLRGLSVGARVTTASIGALRGALALLGGPIGIVIAGMATLPLLLSDTSDQLGGLGDAGGTAASALEAYARASGMAAKEQGELAGKTSAATAAILSQNRVALQTSLEGLKAEYEEVLGNISVSGAISSIADSAVRQNGFDAARFDPETGYYEDLGVVFQDIAVALLDFQRGKIGVEELAVALNVVAGAGQEVADAANQYNLALADSSNIDLSGAEAELVRMAGVAGGFEAALKAVNDAASPAELTLAYGQLSTEMDAAAQAGQALREAGIADTLKLLEKLNLTEAQIEAITQALQGSNDEIQAAYNAAVALGGAAGGITFDAAASSASNLADQLQRAVNAAIKLSSQGVNSLERARINYEFRDNPTGRAGALAGATYDARVGETSAMPDGARRYLDQERTAYVETSVAAEKYRQATITANKASAKAARDANKSGRSGGRAKQSGLFEPAVAQIDRLNRQIEMIGKTRSEVGGLTAKYKLLDEAKKRGIDLDKVQANSNMTVREEIDAQSASIAALTLKYESATERAKFFENAQGQLKDGLLDAIIEGKSFAGVLRNIAKQLARAALEAALFSSGPFAKSGGGGGLLSGLFGGGSGGGGGGLMKLLGFRANGGGVQGGGAYIVNEGTPNSEVFVPSQNGAILNVPQAQAALRGQAGGGSSHSTINININIEGANGDQHVISLVKQGVSAGMKMVNDSLPARFNEIANDPTVRHV